jgi:hypothetical protein
MAQWKFQLCPNEKDSLGKGFRIDPIGQGVEDEVNDALRYPFKFHGVNKLVIRLGPAARSCKDYIEHAGVGTKQYPSFSSAEYLNASDGEKRIIMEDITKDVFRWILAEFDDVEFVHKAIANLGWSDI